MRTLVRAHAIAILLGPSLAFADPFFSAGVAGVADANASNHHCDLQGEVSEGYQTYPNDAFVDFAEGEAEGFSPCSALSGSALSHASASLSSGHLSAYTLAQLGAPPFLQEAHAYAYFSDDVTLFSGEDPVSEFSGGQVGEIRLDVHGSRSAQFLEASARLEVETMNGVTIGDQELEDIQGGESIVVQFTTPVRFTASLDLIADDGQHADFGTTLSVTLPGGYRLDSSSGVLLTPEPDSAALFAVALAATAAQGGSPTRRRSRSRRARR